MDHVRLAPVRRVEDRRPGSARTPPLASQRRRAARSAAAAGRRSPARRPGSGTTATSLISTGQRLALQRHVHVERRVEEVAVDPAGHAVAVHRDRRVDRGRLGIGARVRARDPVRRDLVRPVLVVQDVRRAGRRGSPSPPRRRASPRSDDDAPAASRATPESRRPRHAGSRPASAPAHGFWATTTLWAANRLRHGLRLDKLLDAGPDRHQRRPA